MPTEELRLLLLSHAFSGCDTTSGILGHGNVRILKKMASPNAPKDALDTLLNLRSAREEISKAGIVLFQYIYDRPTTPLHQIRYELYSKLVAKGKFLPQKLPPTDVDKHKFDTKEDQYPSTLKSGYLKTVPFVSDPLLENIKRITKQLLEDRMIEDFKRDVRRAKFLSNGELSLEMSFRDQGSEHSIEP